MRVRLPRLAPYTMTIEIDDFELDIAVCTASEADDAGTFARHQLHRLVSLYKSMNNSKPESRRDGSIKYQAASVLKRSEAIGNSGNTPIPDYDNRPSRVK
jgi:hypothetical protein